MLALEVLRARGPAGLCVRNIWFDTFCDVDEIDPIHEVGGRSGGGRCTFPLTSNIGGALCIGSDVSGTIAGTARALRVDSLPLRRSERGESLAVVLDEPLLIGVLKSGVRAVELRRDSLPTDCRKLERLLEYDRN